MITGSPELFGVISFTYVMELNTSRNSLWVFAESMYVTSIENGAPVSDIVKQSKAELVELQKCIFATVQRFINSGPLLSSLRRVASYIWRESDMCLLGNSTWRVEVCADVLMKDH